MLHAESVVRDSENAMLVAAIRSATLSCQYVPQGSSTGAAIGGYEGEAMVDITDITQHLRSN